MQVLVLIALIPALASAIPASPYHAPAYHAPAPAYHHAPAYHQPSYGYEHPKHNCSVVDVVEPAEVCTPTIETTCAPVDLAIKIIVDKEQCYDVTRTVCTESIEEIDNEICTYSYQKKEEVTTAKTVEVSFEKQCDTQMVTVCQPAQYGYGHHHGKRSADTGYGYAPAHNYCKEVAQETCYNVPVVTVVEPEVTVSYPEPIKTCVNKPILLPRISCADLTENKCITVPEVEDSSVSVEKCVAGLGAPACQAVELTLPKQVCKELTYGHAADEQTYEPAPAPAYAPAPAPAYAPSPYVHHG